MRPILLNGPLLAVPRTKLGDGFGETNFDNPTHLNFLKSNILTCLHPVLLMYTCIQSDDVFIQRMSFHYNMNCAFLSLYLSAMYVCSENVFKF